MGFNFSFREYLHRLGRKKANSARPIMGLGHNPSIMYNYQPYDPFWDRMLYSDLRASLPGKALAVVRGRNNVVLNPTASSAGDVNTTADGADVLDDNGVARGAVKMDHDGRIYPVSASLTITQFTYVLGGWLDAASIPTGYMLLDLHGAGAISSLIGMSIVRTIGGGKYVLDVNVNSFSARQFSVLLSTMDSGGILPTLTPCNNDATGSDSTGYTAAGRISNPAWAARFSAAGNFLRALNWTPCNFDKVRGDGPLTIGLRSVISRDRITSSAAGMLTLSQLVQVCNEAQIGLHYNVSSRTDPSLYPYIATEFAKLNHKIAILEWSNETWNNKFPQGGDLTVQACRLGYDLPPSLAETGPSDPLVVPRSNLYCSNTFTTEAQTLVAVPNGDLYIGNVSGLGWVILKATQLNAIGTAIPQQFSASTAYTTGKMVIGSSGSSVVFCAQNATTGGALPLLYSSIGSYNTGSIIVSKVDFQTYIRTSGSGNGGDPQTNLAQWRLATGADSNWLSATPTAPNGSLWTLVANGSQTFEAHCRFKTTQTKLLQSYVDPAFTAAGKTPPVYSINVQQTSGLASLNLTAQQHLYWDGGWSLYSMVQMAPYQGGALNINGDDHWCCFGGPGQITMGSLTAADKLAAYDHTLATAADVDAAIQTLADKMTAADVVALIGDAYTQVAVAQKALLKAATDARVAAGKATNTNIMWGNYECGFTNNFNNTTTTFGGAWPEYLAGWNTSTDQPTAWSNSKQYLASPGAMTSRYSWDGTELYVALQDNVNVRPSTDNGTTWGHLIRPTSGKTRLQELIIRISRSSGYYTWWRNYHQQWRTRVQSGYISMFQEQQTPAPQVKDLSNWGLLEVGNISTPAWQACTDTNTDWKAAYG